MDENLKKAPRDHYRIHTDFASWFKSIHYHEKPTKTVLERKEEVIEWI